MQNGKGEVAGRLATTSLIRQLSAMAIQPPFTPTPAPEIEMLEIGQEVFLLDAGGNSVLCSQTVDPSTMHMTLLSLADPNSVGKPESPHQGDAPNVFLVCERIRQLSADSRLLAPGAGRIVYELIPKDGYGRDRKVPRRELIVEVRFRPGERVFYLDGEDRLEAQVKGAEVIRNKRVYNVRLLAQKVDKFHVGDELLEAASGNDF